ncbi:hypothetical protein [Soonwooa sp.]|uniref:hypothetical protein n=1 Tax=Soonwooa sp. TaxID=1938592 RepID=UPI00261BCA3A|nr:hypothetical protein [Soonwooa sp.]
MKNYLILLSIFCLALFNSQNRYEAFAKNWQYGIVDTKDLSEYLAPTYTKIDFHFKDYLALQTGAKTDFYSKTTAEKFSLTDQEQDAIKLNNRNYFHYQDATSSYLIPEKVSERIKLSKKYNSFRRFNTFVIASFDKGFDIYDSNLKLIKNIPAPYNYFNYFKVKGNQDLEPLMLFYGDKTIEIYDNQMKLLGNYKSTEKSEETVLSIIKKDFEVTLVPPPTVISPVAAENWISKIDGDKTTIQNTMSPNKQFSLKGRYQARFAISEDWISLEEVNYLQSFQFEVDFKNKKFILPQKYIDELDLKFD